MSHEGLQDRLEVLRREPGAARVVDRGALERVRRAERAFRRQIGAGDERAQDSPLEPGLLLAFAYPDRIAKRRAAGDGRYKLATGRGASFAGPESIARAELIVAVDVEDSERDARILLAAPLSLCGALLLLWLTGTDLNISSAMGLILLVGLVVKNGIMLLDFSEKLHAEGEPFERAIAHAGRIRLRPILMTTFCTLFGLLPLALGLGAGAELQQPLALAVIGGLALSTPVTLLAVPGLYEAVKTRRTAATRS